MNLWRKTGMDKKTPSTKSNTTANLRVAAAQDAEIERLATLWNRDLPQDLPASTRLLEWTLAPHPNRSVALIEERGRQLNAFAIVSKLDASPIGVVDAMVPARRGPRESSLRLVGRAQEWLREQGAAAIQFGGGAYSLLRGIPAAGSRSLDGWTGGVTRSVHDDGEFDLALDVSRYAPPSEIASVAGVVQPAQPRDRDELEAFFGAPAFLQVGATNHTATIDDLALAQEVAFGGRIGDLMLLFTARGVEGVCHLIFADSAVPIDLAYPYTLPKPWGAIGMIAATDRVGDGGMEMLLDAAIRRLHNNGINSCVALGVSAPALYERFGFVRHRAWRQRTRALRTDIA